MTIDKAIEILKLENKHPWNMENSDLRYAVKLSIEALKAWQEHRRIMGHPKLWILPGETKD